MEINKNSKEGGQEMKENFEDLARRNFDLWNDALQSKNPRKVAEMYADDAAFLPTMSPELKHGVTGAEEYFEHFLKKNPFGKIREGALVQLEGDKFYSHSGMYDFEVDGPNGNRVAVAARFIFNWRQEDDGRWKISAHHSSVIPS